MNINCEALTDEMKSEVVHADQTGEQTFKQNNDRPAISAITSL